MFDYDVTGKPAVFTDPLGARTIFSRDSLGRLVTRTDGRGVSQSFAYDQIGRTISRTDAAGTTLYEWDYETGALIKVTNADGSFVSYTHDQAGNLTGAVYSDSKSALYGQSSYGGPSSVRDQSGGATSYSYDQHGQLDSLNSSYYAPGSGFSLVYDASGNVISETNPDGTVQCFTYDNENRMLSFRLSLGETLMDGAEFHYDAAGNRISSTDLVTDETATYTYDSANQLTQVRNSDSITNTYSYDANGNRTQATTTLYMDDFSSSTINPVWNSSSYSSWSLESGVLSASATNSIKLLKSGTDVNDYSIQARINMQEGKDVGLAVRVTSETSFYLVRCSGIADDAGCAIWKQSAGSIVRKANYSLDPLLSTPSLNDWYTLKVTAAGSTISWQYQVNGVWSNLYSWTDPSSPYLGGGVGVRVASASATNHHHIDDVVLSNTYNYTYDKANQLTMIKDSPGNTISALSYDQSGNTSFDGVSYTHDERNRLISVEGTAVGSLAYEYDAMGRLISRSTRPTIIADDFSQGMSPGWQATNPAWSLAMGLGNSVIQGDGLTATTATRIDTGASDYTLSARVKIIATNDISATAGLVFRSDIPQSSAADNNEYYLGIYPGEDMWKLFRVAGGQFGPDPNRDPVAAGSLTIDLNRYYTVSARVEGSQIHVYIDGKEQNSGSPYTDDSPHSYTNVGLRARNALASFDDVIVEGLSYADATQYRYNDKSGALMHELDASGNITTSYVADASGRLVSVTRALNTANPSTFFYHYNAHGDVVAITNADGSIVARFSFDPWGMPTEFDPAGTAVTIGSWTASTGGTPGDGLFILFGGMLYDAAAGLYLTKTRAYNPKTGRFLQRDILDEDAKDGYDGFPFGKDAIGTNLYAWCNNNPVNMVDPSGMFGEGISAGTLRLAQTAQNLSTTAISYHEGCNGLPPSRSGGYAFTGYTAGSRARAQQAKPAPEKVIKYVASLPQKDSSLVTFQLKSCWEAGRPDIDGYLTVTEVNDWRRRGGGTLYADLSKIELISAGVNRCDFDYIGQGKSFQLWLSPGHGYTDGFVYGNIYLTYEGGTKVSAAYDGYDFNEAFIYDSWKPTPRNIGTAIGRYNAGAGNDFTISFYNFGDIGDYPCSW